MEIMERDFKGIWINKEIWLDERLNALEKIILIEIDSLDTEKGCYASNEYLAKFCQCSITKVSTTISKLIELGLIYQEKFDGRTRILKSRLSKIERQTYKILKAEQQKLKTNNINNNKVYNNSPNKGPQKKDRYKNREEIYKYTDQEMIEKYQNIDEVEL